MTDAELLAAADAAAARAYAPYSRFDVGCAVLCRDGRVVGNEHADFRMRWFWRYELEHLLARAGFGEVEIYGDFERGPVATDCPAFVVVAR